MSTQQHSPLSALMVGSLSQGFDLARVIPTDGAEDVVAKLLAEGKLAEAVPIMHPRSLWKKAPSCAEDGDILVCYGTTGNGITLYGPFDDRDSAEEFAERCRPEDEEWQIFCANSPAPQDDDALEVSESPSL